MKQPIISIYVDGKQLLANEYGNVKLRSAIDTILPVLEFTLNDKHGREDSTLNIKLGSFVQVRIIDDSEQSNKWDSTIFVVERLYNGHEYVKGNAGKIQVYCVQAWEFFGDYTSHAYAPQPMSELIQNLCSSANTLAYLNIDEDLFTPTSETRKVPRYKFGESELEFIQNKLLPYAVINNSNSFFFIDSIGRPHLSSYSSMFGATEKIICGPDVMLATDSDANYKQMSIDRGIPVAMYSSLTTDVGGVECFKQLKEKAYMEVSSASDKKIIDMNGTLGLSLTAGGASVSNTIPFDALKFESIKATSAHMYFNRIDSDVIGQCVNHDVALNDLLYASIGINGFAENVETGDTVYLSGPAYNNPESSKKSITWVTGKWLVQASNIVYNGQNPNEVIHVLELIRPTLGYSKATTSISDPTTLAMTD